MSKHCTIIFISSLCFVATSVRVLAQESKVDTTRFFQNTRPALLFGIKKIELTKYEGGIGCAFYGNDELLWRISIDMALEKWSNVWNISNMVKNEMNSYSTSFGVTASPMLVLRRYDPGFVFVAPIVSGNYHSFVSTSVKTDSAATKKETTESDSWSVAAGTGLGVGIILTDRISLTAEYRIAIVYRRKSDTYSDSSSYPDGALIFMKNPIEILYQISSASLTFLFKL